MQERLFSKAGRCHRVANSASSSFTVGCNCPGNAVGNATEDGRQREPLLWKETQSSSVRWDRRKLLAVAVPPTQETLHCWFHCFPVANSATRTMVLTGSNSPFQRLVLPPPGSMSECPAVCAIQTLSAHPMATMVPFGSMKFQILALVPLCWPRLMALEN